MAGSTRCCRGRLVADRVLGEPPAAVHPVGAFGRAMTALERRVWRDSRSAGAGYAGGGVGLGWAAGFALGPSLPAGAAATWLVVAGRALGDEAGRSATGWSTATSTAPGSGCRRWSGGTRSRSTPRGSPGPSWSRWRRTRSTPWWRRPAGRRSAARPGAGFYRAVNTLDAMVGHRNERYGRFGWAAARLDDAANWVPARLTGLLVAAVRPAAAGEILDAVVHPPAHPCPNAGVAEAAFAAALGLRLGGDTVYAGRVDPARPSAPAAPRAGRHRRRRPPLPRRDPGPGRPPGHPRPRRPRLTPPRPGSRQWRRRIALRTSSTAASMGRRPVDQRRTGESSRGGAAAGGARRGVAAVAAALGCDPAEILDLSASLNPDAPDLAALAARHLDSLGRYPDPTAATAAMAGGPRHRPRPGAAHQRRGRGHRPGGGRPRAGGGGGRRSSRCTPGISPRRSIRPRTRLRPDPFEPQQPHRPARRRRRDRRRVGRGVLPAGHRALDPRRRAAGRARRRRLAHQGVRLSRGCGSGYVHADADGHRPAGRPPAAGGRSTGWPPPLVPDLLARADLPGWAAAIARRRAALAAADPRRRAVRRQLRPRPGRRRRGRRPGPPGPRTASWCGTAPASGSPATCASPSPTNAGLARLVAAWESRDCCQARRPAGGADGLRDDERRGQEPRRHRAVPGAGPARACGWRRSRRRTWRSTRIVTPSGHEIGRAQGVQALAAGVDPEVDMNPILLKPTSERTSQVVVLGEPVGHLDAADYHAAKPALRRRCSTPSAGSGPASTSSPRRGRQPGRDQPPRRTTS